MIDKESVSAYASFRGGRVSELFSYLLSKIDDRRIAKGAESVLEKDLKGLLKAAGVKIGFAPGWFAPIAAQFTIEDLMTIITVQQQRRSNTLESRFFKALLHDTLVDATNKALGTDIDKDDEEGWIALMEALHLLAIYQAVGGLSIGTVSINR